MLILSQKRIHQNMIQKVKFIVLITVVLTFSASLIMGCGKKAPPFAPYFIQLPAAQTLEYEITDEKTLKLSWYIQIKNRLFLPGLDGFKIYRSKLSLTDCQDCPLRFELVEDIALDMVTISEDMVVVSGDKEWYPMQYLEVLERNYNYVYKIKTYGKGAKGKDSEEISFNF